MPYAAAVSGATAAAAGGLPRSLVAAAFGVAPPLVLWSLLMLSTIDSMPGVIKRFTISLVDTFIFWGTRVKPFWAGFGATTILAVVNFAQWRQASTAFRASLAAAGQVLSRMEMRQALTTHARAGFVLAAETQFWVWSFGSILWLTVHRLRHEIKYRINAENAMPSSPATPRPPPFNPAIVAGSKT